MTLKNILALDAATCALMGIALAAAAPTLSPLLTLPQDLLFYAGLLLLPIAGFMAILARQAQPWSTGVWLVILGNAAWVLASIVVLATTGPNMLGAVFLTFQAGVVAMLALAEFKAVARRRASIA
ncbi:hypothetical protein [Pelagibacterium lentulum]|uniref:Integral membrane protein n=1 Tax=Pelagibacterium lentulum TaxID=2029865 RepID=A0A916W3D3_9HYPH|nr:hypothetical protein [Pelagibacterium lentulum]GGA62686.1 hypothetical protein GCM10011499_36280 [Pelagibacterium lentulum]